MIDTNVYKNKSAVYYTLGCKLNFSETATIEKLLTEAGFHTARKSEKVDVCIINTCSVTEVADKKCRQIIHRIIRQHPEAYIIVTGCYAQLKPNDIVKIKGVDVILGADKKNDIINHLNLLKKHDNKGDSFITSTKDIEKFEPSCSRGNRTRYFLKIQDGCNYFCTYCTIPFARGKSRNGSIRSLVEQVNAVVKEGGKEVVLTGVNMGDFGKTTNETFADLIKALDNVEGIERYRISSLEPDLLHDEIIDFVAHSKHFMPHFHIPLQSGSDEVLKLMHRRYDKVLFKEKIDLIKKLIPDAFIGIDVIVGTRGEEDNLFEESYDFINSLDITQIHVFSYSERPGTAALRIEHAVHPEIKHLRSQRLLALSEEKLKSFYTQHIGKIMPVLIEKPKPNMYAHGFTPNYIRVEVGNGKQHNNQIINIQLQDFTEDGTALKGIII